MEKQDFIFWVRKLIESYRPSKSVLSQLSQVDLIAIVGPTGVGKTTIIEKLDLPYVKSDVTRPRRPDEKNSHVYTFRDDYEQIINELENGEFVQYYVSKFDEFYGTHSNAYPPSGKASMAVIAQLVDSFMNLGFRSVTPIYIMPPSYAEWMRRVGDVRADELPGRIDEAVTSMIYAREHDSQFHFVLNDDVDLALKDIRAIINGETPHQRRCGLANDMVDVLLRYLGEV